LSQAQVNKRRSRELGPVFSAGGGQGEWIGKAVGGGQGQRLRKGKFSDEKNAGPTVGNWGARGVFPKG